jgi:hypothetical protein
MRLSELGLTPTQFAEADRLDPDYVQAWLDHLEQTTGVRAPAAWFMAAIRTGRMPGEPADSLQAKRVHLAEQWIRHAGLYEPTADSLEEALFGKSGCLLYEWAGDVELRARMVASWERERSRADRAEAEFAARIARHRETAGA